MFETRTIRTYDEAFARAHAERAAAFRSLLTFRVPLPGFTRSPNRY